MNKLIDLVVCTYKGYEVPYLYEAPGNSGLLPGDRVIVDSKRADGEMYVRDIMTIANVDEELIRFAASCASADLPLPKIQKQITFRNFNYEEVKEDE